MLKEYLKERLQSLTPHIEIIKNYWNNAGIETRYHQLEEKTTQETFWQDPAQATILKELQQLKTERATYTYIVQTFHDLPELIDLFADDPAELEKVGAELGALIKKTIAFKVQVLLKEPDDAANCYLHINAGAGGTESQDWAEMLLRMYNRFCERIGLRVLLIDYQSGEGAGIKSATLAIEGKNSYGLLKAESGIHRLVRISPFDANKRRHTSFAAVSVFPEVQGAAIEVNQKDLRIDTYRAGGAGGQHVNKTESAVRITHIPTGIVVQCQNERSQIQNRETAMKMLYAKLAQKQRQEEDEKRAKVEKKSVEWGSQIRSYVLHPYKMVKDHRTEHESFQPELVLDGDLMDFIESYLVQQAKN